jgi:TPR repeat protein
MTTEQISRVLKQFAGSEAVDEKSHAILEQFAVNQRPRRNKITDLNLHRSEADDKIIAWVGDNLKGLKHLDISATRITDSGMMHIAKLHRLNILGLHRLSIETLEFLGKTLKNLRYLWMQDDYLLVPEARTVSPDLQVMNLQLERYARAIAMFSKLTRLDVEGHQGEFVAWLLDNAESKIENIQTLFKHPTLTFLAADQLNNILNAEEFESEFTRIPDTDLEPERHEKLRRLLKKAAIGGHPEARLQFARFLESEAKSIQKGKPQALYYMKLAAGQHCVNTVDNAHYLYAQGILNGWGGATDVIEAEKHFHLAVLHGTSELLSVSLGLYPQMFGEYNSDRQIAITNSEHEYAKLANYLGRNKLVLGLMQTDIDKHKFKKLVKEAQKKMNQALIHMRRATDMQILFNHHSFDKRKLMIDDDIPACRGYTQMLINRIDLHKREGDEESLAKAVRLSQLNARYLSICSQLVKDPKERDYDQHVQDVFNLADMRRNALSDIEEIDLDMSMAYMAMVANYSPITPPPTTLDTIGLAQFEYGKMLRDRGQIRMARKYFRKAVEHGCASAVEAQKALEW